MDIEFLRREGEGRAEVEESRDICNACTEKGIYREYICYVGMLCMLCNYVMLCYVR